MRHLKKVTHHPHILLSDTRVPSLAAVPLAPPRRMLRECLNPYPRSQGSTCRTAHPHSHTLPLQAWHPISAFHPPPSPPRLPIPPPLLPFHTRCVFAEPPKPSQASDIYSLELEKFLFLFPRARLQGEISPGFLLALLEVKCQCRTGFCQPSTDCVNRPLLGTHCAPGTCHELVCLMHLKTLCIWCYCFHVSDE